MLSLTQKLLAMTSAVVLCACAPAAQQNADAGNSEVSSTMAETSHAHGKATKDNLHRTTVKPGADISLNSILPKSMTSGSYQTVTLEFTDGYQAGVMTVSIEPSEGLNLFGGSNSKTFNMATPGPHVWDVDVKADVDGVYFLNIFSEAGGQPRSFSVRVDMGVVTQKMLDDVMPAEGELTDGGKIRALEANETIK